MKLVIFGLTVTSSWGNGHATIWRGLLGSLARLGHDVTFFERNVPYYAAHRDLHRSSQYTIALYDAWDAVRNVAQRELDHADAAIVTSYCPDALAATDRKVFYDLDTPVTLDALSKSGSVDYVPAHGFADFDLVLSLLLAPARALPEKRFLIGGAQYPGLLTGEVAATVAGRERVTGTQGA